MKVLIIGPISSPIVRRLWGHLKTQNIEVKIASHNAKGVEGVIDLGELKSFFDYLNFYKINTIVTDFEPDIVHAHVLNHYGLMCAFQSKPLLVALWGSDVMLAPYQGAYFKKAIYKYINKYVLKKATRLHTSGIHVADEAGRQYKEAINKVDVFYWGFALQKPENENFNTIAADLEQEFGITGDDYIVFPRGLGPIYNPNISAKIINALLDAGIEKKIIVFKGFATNEHETSFLGNVDRKKIIYVDRLLNEGELYSIYSRSTIHFSIPTSDSLGGGVVEPALLGSFPILSNLPSYENYLCENQGFMLKNFSDKSISLLVERIKNNEFHNSKSNMPKTKYNTKSVISNIIKTYNIAIEDGSR